MDMDLFLPHMDGIYQSALMQTRDEHLAQELVQETYLHLLEALAKNTTITHPKAYLQSVMRNCFFMHLRKKYKLSTVYFGDLPQEPPHHADFSALERSQDGEAIRRELAFLSHTYREVMVRYYMKNQSVAHIAQALSIPKGTVLSRLDMGRKKLREGMTNMEHFKEHSYHPQGLYMSINGRTGQGGEPFSCIHTAIEQNILIVAYEKPLTVAEIAQALGTPMAFIENSVEKLVDAQLMKREGQRVATDFFIRTQEDKLPALAAAKDFAASTFDTANPIVMDMVEKYSQIPGFAAFNPTQKYLCALLSIRIGIEGRIFEAATGKAETDYEDYPDRPNYGKWIAFGTRDAHNISDTDRAALEKYAAAGRNGQGPVNDYIASTTEYRTALGPFNQAGQFKYSLTIQERAQLIDALRTDTVNAFQAQLLPDMHRLGLVTADNQPAVPYITQAELVLFHNIERDSGAEFFQALREPLVDMYQKSKIPYPKRIPFGEESAYGLPLGYLVMAYAYEAAARGVIEIEDGKHYPVMYLVMQ